MLSGAPQALFHLSGFLPGVLLAGFWYLFLHRSRTSMWRIALLALPGTFVHELMHFIFGLFLLAKPAGFSVWPRHSGKGWTLGSVSFQRIGLLNGAFVALAPLLLFPLAWLCLIRFAVPFWVQHRWGWWLVAGYGTATMLFAALPSCQDIRLGSRSLVFYGVIGGLGWWGLSAWRAWLH
ncbi:MAG: hypothetical protein HY282_13180 [Nitrospirae bacterium]|nr:hypothetical protein [Candidatus Manganitrophaceae bacterium]